MSKSFVNNSRTPTNSKLSYRNTMQLRWPNICFQRFVFYFLKDIFNVCICKLTCVHSCVYNVLTFTFFWCESSLYFALFL